MGLGEKFQLWSPEAFEERRTRAPKRAHELKRLFSERVFLNPPLATSPPAVTTRLVPSRLQPALLVGPSVGARLATRPARPYVTEGQVPTATTETRHIPFLLAEVLSELALEAGDIYVDCTFGAGGYTRAILETAACRVIALDRDPNAIRDGQHLVEAFARA